MSEKALKNIRKSSEKHLKKLWKTSEKALKNIRKSPEKYQKVIVPRPRYMRTSVGVRMYFRSGYTCTSVEVR